MYTSPDVFSQRASLSSSALPAPHAPTLVALPTLDPPLPDPATHPPPHQVRDFCESLGGAAAETPVVQALALLVDVCAAEENGRDLSRAMQLCKQLETLDPIRVLYWQWRGKQLHAK